MIEYDKVTKFSTTVAIILYVVTFLGAMYLGSLWSQARYTGACLDMGGGMNLGNYNICVIEK